MKKFLLTDKEDIINWLKVHNVEHYELVTDSEYGYLVNVNAEVNLHAFGLSAIEVKFHIVKGSFNCCDNNLKSLKGVPQEVGGSFNCEGNKLTSLKYCPQIVGKNFICSDNELINLHYAPTIVEGSFWCKNNNLISLEGSPQKIAKSFYCQNNKLQSLQLKDLPKHLGMYIYLNDNSLLRKFEEIHEITKIKDLLNIEEEYKLLNNTINSSTIRKELLKL